MASMALFSNNSIGQEEKKGWGDKAGPDVLSPFNVIGTKADVPTLQGSGTVLDSSDLAPFFHTDINDILRQVPGVYVRPETGYGLFPNISMRGVDPERSNKVTIMEDGIPSSPAPYADPAAYYAPTAGRMAGFEVLKGSSSLKHGPNTTGGVINYLSTPIPNQQMSHLRASYGSYNERIVHAYSGGKTDFAGGKLGYLLEVFDHRSDGFQDIGSINGEPAADTPIAKTDLMLKLSYEIGDGNYFEFKAGRTDLDADVSYQGLSATDFAATPYHRYVGTYQDNMDSDQQRYYLRYKKDFSDVLAMTTTLYYNEFNRNWYKLAGGATEFDDADGAGSDFDILRGNSPGTYTVKANNRSYFTKGIQTNFDYEMGIHDFDLGFRYQDDHYIKNPWSQDTYTVVANTSIAKAPVAKGAVDPYKDAEAFEAHLVDNIDLGNLSLTPGIRYSSIEYQYNGANDRKLDDVLLGVGAGYKVSDSLGLFGGIHQGHTFPDAQSASNHASKGLRSIEESLNIEIGARGTIANAFYEIAYFNTSLEDMLILSSLSGGASGSANVGDGSINGLEVLIGTDLGSDTGWGIPVSASATFTNTEFESATSPTDGYLKGATAGNEFPFIPDFMINLRAGLEGDKARTYLNYHYQNEVYVNGSNTRKIGAYGILNWSAFYDISEGVSVFGKISNLTDEVYAHSVLPDGYRVGAPQTWTIGMSYDF
jgi:Fe(3+) dicitrate transport protein